MRLGLALSGGGFRATLFHLGVVRFLHDVGRLKSVNRICSVSGGSILGAHLVQNWDKYTGSDAEFDKAAKELLRFVRADIRGRILRRIPCFVLATLVSVLLRRSRWLKRYTRTGLLQRYTRTGLLEHYYAKFLFHHEKLHALQSRDHKRPYLHILATNLTNGGLCSFTNEGFSIDFDPITDAQWPKFRQANNVPIALAVAASSAFPAFFPPVTITDEILEIPPEDFEPRSQLFTDGGVNDNLGARKFRQLFELGLGALEFEERDIKDVRRLATRLAEAGASPTPSPGRRIMQRATKAFRRTVSDNHHVNAMDDAELQRFIITEFNNIMQVPGLYARDAWRDIPLSKEENSLLSERRNRLSTNDVIRLNRRLLEKAFPEHLADNTPQFDHIILSDAAQRFERMYELRFFGLGAPIRATDILMYRVSTLESDYANQMAEKEGYPFVHLKVQKEVDPTPDCNPPDSSLQRQLPKVRTDFDRFFDAEISALVRHGYCVAQIELESRLGVRAPSSGPWDPTVRDGLKRDDKADNRFLRRYSPVRHLRLFWWKDWISWSNAVIFLLLLATGGSVFSDAWSSGIDRDEAEWAKAVLRDELIPWASKEPPSQTLVDRLTLADSFERADLIAAMPSWAAEHLEWARPKLEEIQETVTQRLRGVMSVRSLDAPDYSAFQVLSDTRVVDLQWWQLVPQSRRDERVSPAVWRRLTRVRRLASATDDLNDKIRFQYLTSGLAIDMRVPDDRFPFVVRRAVEPSNVGARETTVWEIEVDVSSERVGPTFDVLTEAVFWNGFQGAKGDWAAVRIDAPVDKAALWILFPESKPYKKFTLYKYPTGARLQRSVIEGEVIANRTRRSLYWRIPNPDAQHTYEIGWSW